MDILLSVLSLFLVATAAAGGRHVPDEAGESKVLAYYTPSEVMAYWQTVLPNTTMPSALLGHLNALAGPLKSENTRTSHSKKKEHGDQYSKTDSRQKDGIKFPYMHWKKIDAKSINDDKSPYIYWSINPQEKEDDDKSPYIYGSQGQNKQDHGDKSPYIYWSKDSKIANEDDKSPYIYGSRHPNKQDHGDKFTDMWYQTSDSKMEKVGGKSPYIYESTNENKQDHGDKSPYIYWSSDLKIAKEGEKSPYIYWHGSQNKQDHGDKSPYIYWTRESKIAKEGVKSPYIYGSTQQNRQDHAADRSPYMYWSSDSKMVKDGQISPYIYGTTDQNKQDHVDKSPYIYWSSDSKIAKKGEKSPYIYGTTDQKKQDHGDKSSYMYWSRDLTVAKEGDKSSYIYGSTDLNNQNHGGKSSYMYWSSGSKIVKDGDKSPYIYGSTSPNKQDHGERSPYIYWNSGSKMAKEGDKSPYIYESTNPNEQDHSDNKFLYMYWTSDSIMAKEIDKAPYIYWWSKKKGAQLQMEDVKEKIFVDVEDQHYLHNHRHKDRQFNMENFLFTEEVLTHGTIIAPCIKPSTSPAPFLRHEIANSISLTIKNFPNILEMFAPKSHALASDIWSNIRSCENIHLAENQTCATSMNSMIMFVTSVLGTRNLQAFSSSEVPVEGISSGSQRYMVVAARRVTTSRSKMEETTMTCHGVEFPFAVFYCHTENPTRIYEVNLENQEDAQTKTTMRALVVCHLDTSKFDPKIPFFAKRHIKPGDVPLCHFLERGGILWAPAAASAQDDGISIAR